MDQKLGDCAERFREQVRRDNARARWKQKLKGSALQLLGWVLLFAGIFGGGGIFAVGALVFPQVPVGWFALGAFAVGGPLAAYGIRLQVRGRGVETGAPEATERKHLADTRFAALAIGFVLLLACLAALPLFAAGVGFPFPNRGFVVAWYVGWFVTFLVFDKWTTRPLWRALTSRARARWDVTADPTERTVTGAPAPRRADDGTVRVDRTTSETP
jgi:hypothetical protein